MDEKLSKTEQLVLEAEIDKKAHTKGLALAIGALGVVFGDIGTSPLYTLQACFNGAHAIKLDDANLLGVISLLFWSLTIVVGIKYLTFIMRADNNGEGGMFALLSHIMKEKKKIPEKLNYFIILIGLMGASLLYGDGIITPAISVLSAVEGLEIATAAAKPITVPLTCVILFMLFFMQSRGTKRIGRVFGPIMCIWFATLAFLGIVNIIKAPHILAAINPFYVFNFFATNSIHAFIALGSVVLCLTGCEALYADMGHFGRKPIRLSWFALVYPALLLNYMGQGALLLASPEKVVNPFYSLVPKEMIYPMVILATAATVIASQALISGVFSLTRQAIQLGFLPRLNIVHTSAQTEGQIYIPAVNKMLMILCIAIVIAFKQSTNLAAAYGVAVTADMVLTSTVFFFVMRTSWNWPLKKALPLVSFFLLFDLMYFSSNLLKFFSGGWFPLALALVVLNVMLTWRDGRKELARHLKNKIMPIEFLLNDVIHSMERVSGSAVFMSSLKGIPPVLSHHIKHNKVLHSKVIILSIRSKHVPAVSLKDTLEVTPLGHGLYRIVAWFGFMQTPDVPRIMEKAMDLGLITNPKNTTYFLGRESLLSSAKSKLSKWRKSLFIFMSRNAQPATTFFNIPSDRVVEIGMQIEL